MAYIPSEVTLEEYEDTIYSGQARHRLYLRHGETIIQNASPIASKLIWKRRILSNGSKTFSLDNFVSQDIELTLHDYQIQDLTEEIEIKIGTYIDSYNDYVYVPLGIYKIQDNPTTDKNKTTYKLRDRSVKFDFNYNAQPLIERSGNSATKLQILQDICSQAGITYVGDTNFLGATDLIGIYDNTVSARVYISYIFEQSGRFVFINREGNLDSILLTNLTVHTLYPGIVENYKFGDNFTISKVIYESGIIKYESGNSTKDILYLNSANPYISSQIQVDSILSLVNGFNIYSFNTGRCIGNPAIDPYDIIELTYNNATYRTLAQYDLDFTGVLTSKYNTTIEYEAKQSNVSVNSEATFRKFAKTNIDNLNGEVSLMSGQISDQNEQIGIIRLQYNELLAKISDIADITTSAESSYASVPLTNVNTSQPISVKIHPISENISYLYPSANLYPSSTLYLKSRTLRFANTTTNEVFDWELPTDLWYYDSTTYDELELSYGDGTNSNVIVTRKCKINADGTISVLATPTTETYPYPSDIVLTDGDYTVSLLGYTTGYLFVQLMAKNIYTTQFYTKAETNTLLDQTSSSITASVNQTLSNYSTTSEMNSAINLKANEITQSVSQSEDLIWEDVNKKANTEDVTNIANDLTSDINQNSNQINNNYQEIINKFNGYAPKSDVVTLTQSVETIQTNTYTKTEINTKLEDGSVTKVHTVSGTFDENGMTYEKTNAPTKTTINEIGVNVKDNTDNSVLFAGYVDENNTQYSDYEGQTLVATNNIIVNNYLVIGNHSRIQDYEDGTGIFYVG